MTLSYEPETRLDASAHELLDSLNSLIVREARQVATRRPNDPTVVSSSDILASSKERRKSIRTLDLGAFSLQVTLAAFVISAMAVSFAAILSLGENSSRNDVAITSKSLLTMVLLATLIIVSAVTLLTILRQPKEQRQSDRTRSHSSAASQYPSSRRGRELALLRGWSDFEELVKREIYANPSEAPVHDLSGDIARFSQLYDLDPEEIRFILRTRNAVAHDPRSTSAAEVRESLLRLQSLIQKLSLLRSA